MSVETPERQGTREAVARVIGEAEGYDFAAKGGR